MAYTVVSLVLALVVVAVYGQTPFPTGFNRPPPRRVLNLNKIPLPRPGGRPRPTVTRLSQTYCPLKFQEPYRDPAIIEVTEVELTQARQAAGRRLNADQKRYLDGKRMQAQNRAQRRAADGRGGSSPGRGRPTAGPPRGGGRSKRQSGPPIMLLSPTEKKPVCRSVEKKVQAVLHNDEIFYLFEDDEVTFWECRTQHASVPNIDIRLQRYYCENDNYVWQTVMAFNPVKAFDPSGGDPVDWVSMYVPVSCCARRHSCDFTPYSSADGPKRFSQQE